jgi:hydrogenase/urease accessory protein HupE
VFADENPAARPLIYKKVFSVHGRARSERIFVSRKSSKLRGAFFTFASRPDAPFNSRTMRRFGTIIRRSAFARPMLLCVWIFVAGILPAAAHDPGLSSLQLKLKSNEIGATLTLSKADVDRLPNIPNRSQTKSQSQFIKGEASLRALLMHDLILKSDGVRADLGGMLATNDSENNLIVTFAAPLARTNLEVECKFIQSLPSGHREFLSLLGPDGSLRDERLLSASRNRAEFEMRETAGSSEAPPAGFTGFLLLGIRHILTGYDHLLFLFALLIACPKLRELVKVITCFTVAHSITLALAALDLVQAPSIIVEPAIAASIAFVGFENWRRGGENKKAAWLAFGFGLIHGFGFAAVLREMGIAKADSVWAPLLAFNLGVETGQLAVAAAIVPLLWWARTKPDYSRRWAPAFSLIITGIGIFWFLQRLTG